MAGKGGGGFGKAQFSSDPVQLYINDNSLRLEPCQEKLIKVKQSYLQPVNILRILIIKNSFLQKVIEIHRFTRNYSGQS